MIRIVKFGAVAAACALAALPVMAQNPGNGMGGQTGQNQPGQNWNTDQNGDYRDQNRSSAQSWNSSNTNGQSNQGWNGGQASNSGQNSSAGFNGQNSNSLSFSRNGFGNPNQFRSAAFQQMQNLTQDLQQAGYSNVQIMPESFLVSAQDPQGRQVVMLVRPDASGQNDPDDMATNRESQADAGVSSQQR
jgi:hypothetical protein